MLIIHTQRETKHCTNPWMILWSRGATTVKLSSVCSIYSMPRCKPSMLPCCHDHVCTTFSSVLLMKKDFIIDHVLSSATCQRHAQQEAKHCMKRASKSLQQQEASHDGVDLQQATDVSSHIRPRGIKL